MKRAYWVNYKTTTGYEGKELCHTLEQLNDFLKHCIECNCEVEIVTTTEDK